MWHPDQGLFSRLLLVASVVAVGQAAISPARKQAFLEKVNAALEQYEPEACIPALHNFFWRVAQQP